MFPRNKKAAERLAVRAAPVLAELMEPLYLLVFTHYPTQNRFALLLEMLLSALVDSI
ncbi:hypothetical protein CEV32_2749 [Brucella rhizosphaerae]|uniref:Uncharacterized protein n=1 Tax=Brucella rhizosphaerae TaxID=571254 RepID=A0A256EZJ1_9HYPH|nr:hypothetical protein CEV32_2749 [Brucella rhizosphaerae]